MGIYKNNIKKKRIDKKKLYCLLTSFFITLWIMPVYNNSVAIGRHTLDASWRVGLNWGDMLNLDFGKDLIFTYGPLYFLSGDVLLNIYKPVYIFGNVLSLILWFAALFFIILSIAERLRFTDLKSKIISFLVILFASFSFLFVHIELPALLLILSFLLIINISEKNYSRSINMLYIVSAGLLLALISMNKFLYVAGSLSLIVLSAVIFLILKKPRNIIILMVSYFGFFLGIWLALEKNLKNLLLYFKNGLILSSGYSEYMNFHPIGKEKYLILFAFVVLILWACLFIERLVKRDRKLIFYFLLSLPFLFIVYKEGFTRQDSGHLIIYFGFIIYLFIVTSAFFWQKMWKIIPIFLILIIFAIPFTKLDFTFNAADRLFGNYNKIATFVKSVVPCNSDDYVEMLENDKKVIREKDTIDDCILEQIEPGESVDIFPWEVYIPYVYNLNWHPRPVFQSYTAYKPELDRINSEHFLGDDAPDKIIYRIDSIDDRYAIFDEPATFREIIKNYDLICTGSNNFGVLQKKRDKGKFEEVIIKKVNYSFGEMIDLPEVSGGYLFGMVNIELNIEGKIRNLLYRGDYLYIEFFLRDGEKEWVAKRFIRENGRNGFFLSGYIEDIFDLREVFEQQDSYKCINNIESIKITASNDTFCDSFDVEFYKLKFPAKEYIMNK